MEHWCRPGSTDGTLVPFRIALSWAGSSVRLVLATRGRAGQVLAVTGAQTVEDDGEVAVAEFGGAFGLPRRAREMGASAAHQ
jgi:hypothetical protein